MWHSVRLHRDVCETASTLKFILVEQVPLCSTTTPQPNSKLPNENISTTKKGIFQPQWARGKVSVLNRQITKLHYVTIHQTDMLGLFGSIRFYQSTIYPFGWIQTPTVQVTVSPQVLTSPEFFQKNLTKTMQLGDISINLLHSLTLLPSEELFDTSPSHILLAKNLLGWREPWWGVNIFTRNKLTSWRLNHPFEKYARQNGSSPQVELNIKNIWNHYVANIVDGLSPVPNVTIAVLIAVFLVLTSQ